MQENAQSLLLVSSPAKTTRPKVKLMSVGEFSSLNIKESQITRTKRKSLSDSPVKPNAFQNKINNRTFHLRPSQLKMSQSLNKFTKSSLNSELSQLVKKRSKIEKDIEAFLNSTPVLILMSLFTIYALFSSDIQAAWLRQNVDLAFNIIPCCLFGIFTIEFLLNCIAKKDYIFSFFFWLDLLATISFIQDIDYIMNPILGYSQTSGINNKKSVQAAKAVAKVSSASRATRVLRVIRIIRLIRMIKLYKTVYIARENAAKVKEELKRKEMQNKEKELPSINSSIEGSSKVLNLIKKNDISATRPSNGTNDLVPNEKMPINNCNIIFANESIHKEAINVQSHKRLISKPTLNKWPSENNGETNDDEELIKESKISKLVNESITKKVIVIILILLIIIPLISEDFYADDSIITYSLVSQLLANSINLNGNFSLIKVPGMNELFDENFPVLNISSVSNGYLFYENTSYSKDYFRYKETKVVYSNDGSIQIMYSILKETQMNGWLNALQTIFVCFCLVIATMSFENETDKLVLQPLELMIEIVETVAKDPINAKNIENLQMGIKATISKTENAHENVYEIQVIKSAIIKISALLAIGFGEAGGEIIQKNLTSTSELNPRLKGKKKSAIFGFCDIRQFDSITLALEEKTMVFVNEIAEIVHSSVDLLGGATNKNIGEAFLNVWKFYNETVVKGNSKDKKQIKRKDNLLQIDPTNPQVAITADCAAWAFLRILMKINKRWNILEYRQNQEINKRIKDFRLNMGFGLHMGYGIEGAVGSTYKIDASYLSPNVNIAARLESATRQFGVPILISGVVYKLFSPEMKSLCRYLDCVKVKGSELPIDLYTIDVNLNISQQNKENILIMANKNKRQYYNEKKENFKREIELNGNVTRLILEKSSYLEMLKTKKTDKFYTLWDEGIAHYQKGNFRSAGERFNECLSIDLSDGPARTLLSYIQSCSYHAPSQWNGTRELLSK